MGFFFSLLRTHLYITAVLSTTKVGRCYIETAYLRRRDLRWKQGKEHMAVVLSFPVSDILPGRFGKVQWAAGFVG